MKTDDHTVIIYEGETYYLYCGKIVDEYFIEAPEFKAAEVAESYFSAISYASLLPKELTDFIRSAKKAGAYETAFKAAEYALKLEDDDLATAVLPTYTSLARGMGASADAIKVAEKYLRRSDKFTSVALLTSLAAAYCDVCDYDKAKRACDRAYALQGGSVGYRSELNLVYARIAKETKQ